MAVVPEGTEGHLAFTSAFAAVTGLLVLGALAIIRPSLGVWVVLMLGTGDFVTDILYLLTSSYVHPAVLWVSVANLVLLSLHYIGTYALMALLSALAVVVNTIAYTPWFARWELYDIRGITVCDINVLVFLLLYKLAWVIVYSSTKIVLVVLSMMFLLYQMSIMILGLFLYLLRLTILASVDKLLCKLLAARPDESFGIVETKSTVGELFWEATVSDCDSKCIDGFQVIFLSEVFLEDIPQLVLQVVNNQLLGGAWSSIAVISVCFTLCMLSYYGSRFVVHFFAFGEDLSQVPVGAPSYTFVTPVIWKGMSDPVVPVQTDMPSDSDTDGYDDIQQPSAPFWRGDSGIDTRGYNRDQDSVDADIPGQISSDMHR